MKHFKTILILSTVAVAGIISANGRANEMNVEGAVSFEESCAPWDGTAYRLNFDLPADPDFPKAHFTGSVWEECVTNLYKGIPFSLDGPEGSIHSAGDAYVSNPDQRGIFVKAKFTPMRAPNTIQEPVGIGQWMIEIPMPPPSTKKFIYTINPVIKGQGQALCG